MLKMNFHSGGIFVVWVKILKMLLAVLYIISTLAPNTIPFRSIGYPSFSLRPTAEQRASFAVTTPGRIFSVQVISFRAFVIFKLNILILWETFIGHCFFSHDNSL